MKSWLNCAWAGCGCWACFVLLPYGASSIHLQHAVNVCDYHFFRLNSNRSELSSPFQASFRFKAVANWDYPTFQLCFKFVSDSSFCSTLGKSSFAVGWNETWHSCLEWANRKNTGRTCSANRVAHRAINPTTGIIHYDKNLWELWERMIIACENYP